MIVHEVVLGHLNDWPNDTLTIWHSLRFGSAVYKNLPLVTSKLRTRLVTATSSKAEFDEDAG